MSIGVLFLVQILFLILQVVLSVSSFALDKPILRYVSFLCCVLVLFLMFSVFLNYYCFNFTCFCKCIVICIRQIYFTICFLFMLCGCFVSDVRNFIKLGECYYDICFSRSNKFR